MRIADGKGKDTSAYINEVRTRMESVNEKLNAVVTFCETKQQISNLAEVDTSFPLYGVPIVLKDNVSTKGIRTTASSRILDNYVPIYDAHIVDVLKQAGAIIMAKSSMDELGMGGTNVNAYTGKVNNPWDVSRISGGSSGGSAALVAAGVCPLAIGTDTGDSVRKPASYCGVVGVKPTYGRISRYGIIPYASSLDHVGYFTTNIKDAAQAFAVLAQRDVRDMTSSTHSIPAYETLISNDVSGQRIAVLKNVQDAIENSAITDGFDAIVEGLKAKGAIVEEVVFDKDIMNTLLPTYYVLSNAEATANHSNLDGIRFGVQEEGDSLEDIMIRSRTKGFSSLVRKRFVIGSYSLFAENQEKLFRKAQRVRRVIVNELQTKMEGFDAIIASAAGSVAPHPQESYGENLSATHLVAENHMLLANFSGYPSLTLPATMVEGLPVGINVMCPPFKEVEMFSLAQAIEDITKLDDVTAEVCK